MTVLKLVALALVVASSLSAAPSQDRVKEPPVGLPLGGEPPPDQPPLDQPPDPLAEFLAVEDPFTLPDASAGKKALPPVARDPFLLAKEQQAQASLTDILRREKQQLEQQRVQAGFDSQAGQQRDQKAQEKFVLGQYVSRLQLSAVLIAARRGAALIDRRLVHEGDLLMDGRLLLSKVTPSGLLFQIVGQEQTLFKDLLPPDGGTTKATETKPEGKEDRE